jgi:hypothetical protein
MPKCRDCKLYDLEAVKSKSGAVLSNRVARCLWKSKEQSPILVSFRHKPAEGGYIVANTAHRCPTFQKRETA